MSAVSTPTPSKAPSQPPPAPGPEVAAAATARGKERSEKALKNFHEEGTIGKAYDARLLRRLWPFVKPHAKFIVVSLTTLVVITLVNLVRPLLIGDVVHQAGARDP
ncbi:MAG TPA: hypothetical protein VHV30_04805, partial [Polyangiaceae bacterium]|nr:hypothetical protein [Polyangiaceae bacterium]